MSRKKQMERVSVRLPVELITKIKELVGEDKVPYKTPSQLMRTAIKQFVDILSIGERRT